MHLLHPAARGSLCAAFALVASAVTARAQKPNVLLIVADDLGNDRVGAYAEHPDPGHTPNLDALAAQGVLFRNAWANPLCSPTRATILTGRYCFRTGVGANILAGGSDPELSLDEVLLPEVLTDYASVALGKWHLGYDPLHPNQSGFLHFKGSLHNLDRIDNDPPSYYRWTKIEDGVGTISETYATTDTADETVAAMSTLAEPWFVYCAFNAPHDPYHAPPDELHTYDLTGDPNDDVPLFVRATIEAMDTEIGRILQAVPPNTYVIFLGDNGTENKAVDGPTDKARNKGSVYEGGVNVPLIITGPGVVPGECGALVNSTDLYATVAELGGAWSGAEDSVSLVPYLSDPALPSLRETVFAETFGPVQFRRTIRDARYKLIRERKVNGVSEELYDLQADPGEQMNLLVAGLDQDARAAYDHLRLILPPGAGAIPDCPQPANSGGTVGVLTAIGSQIVDVNALALHATLLPTHRVGSFLVGQGADPILQIGKPGVLCLGGAAFAKYPPFATDQDGRAETLVYLDALPFTPTVAVQPGETWRFQAWVRDSGHGGGASFTNALQITFD